MPVTQEEIYNRIREKKTVVTHLKKLYRPNPGQTETKQNAEMIAGETAENWTGYSFTATQGDTSKSVHLVFRARQWYELWS